MNDCRTQGQPVPPERIGPLVDRRALLDNPEALRAALEEDGYLLLRGVLIRDEVLAARREVFERLAAVDEIAEPPVDGIATGRSRRREQVEDLGKFWTSVSQGKALRRVTHGERLGEVMSVVFGEPARPHDYLFLRPGAVGRATKLHYDFPFFAGGSSRIVTTWIALGDVPVRDGPLALVERSNRMDDLIASVRSAELDGGTSFSALQSAAYQEETRDTLAFLEARNTRLLTADFHAGDLLVFGMFTMHGSLDNHSPQRRVRLSCDVRYQPAADVADDPRYFGTSPIGAKGGSYGEQKAARPLTEPWE